MSLFADHPPSYGTSAQPQVAHQQGVEISLQVANFNIIYTATFKSACQEWKDIGSFLEVDPNTIGRIEKEKKDDVKACYREMVMAWLKCNNPPPTKAKILQALRALDLNEAANNLESKQL